jgi:hypothetical protein
VKKLSVVFAVAVPVTWQPVLVVVTLPEVLMLSVTCEFAPSISVPLHTPASVVIAAGVLKVYAVLGQTAPPNPIFTPFSVIVPLMLDTGTSVALTVAVAEPPDAKYSVKLPV